MLFVLVRKDVKLLFVWFIGEVIIFLNELLIEDVFELEFIKLFCELYEFIELLMIELFWESVVVEWVNISWLLVLIGGLVVCCVCL